MSEKPRIAAVIFDMDDTLYPERDYVRSGYRAVGRYLKETLGPSKFSVMGMEPDVWLWERFLSGQTAGSLDALNERYRLGLSSAEVQDLVKVYREHKPDIRPYEGIEATLADLRGRCRLGLLSDGFLPAQQIKLDALKLERFFEVIVFTEKMGRKFWKPAPDGFHTIRSRLQVDNNACAYVGDNPSKDFVAPNSLGWLTIQYRQPDQIHAAKPTAANGQPKVVVSNAAQLWQALMG